VRHGEPSQVGLLLGHSDIKLSALGEQQLTDCFANLQFDRLITSPLQRCFVSADKIAKQRNVTLEVTSSIKEMDFGDWDGLSYETLWQQSPSIGDFWQNPTQVTPPNGETLLSFQERVNTWWQNLIKEDKGDVVIVTHAGVIKQVLANLFNDEEYLFVPNKVKVNYAGVVRIEVKLDNESDGNLNKMPNAWPMLTF
jgi:alpha-ribazole phosphatase